MPFDGGGRRLAGVFAVVLAAGDGAAAADELHSAARVPVFLLDENHVVRPGEMGTVRDITAAAQERGIAVTHIDLDAQFRCGGSLEFIDWVEGPAAGWFLGQRRESRRRGQVTESEFDRLVRTVYKVLLTRGMLGVGIYSTDRETREFVARFV